MSVAASILNQVPKPLDSGEVREFQSAFDLVNPHLQSIEERIRQQAREFDPAVEGYVDYVCASGGKRLRPVMALLSGGATGNISTSHIDLAVILELIHVATLVHDDIMDSADVRREQPTANAKWGNAITVLLGDALFAHALRLATGFENTEVCRRIADASVEVCSGEIIQTQRRFDLNLGIPDYFRIIEMKTAALFSAACELGAFLNGAETGVIQSLRDFGLKLGIAYQIYDDCVDLVGSEASAGKTLGTDLRKGKFTLPVLVMLQQAGNGSPGRARELLLEEDADPLELVELIEKCGALRQAVESGSKILKEAESALQHIPETKFRNGLLSISAFVGKLLRDLI